MKKRILPAVIMLLAVLLTGCAGKEGRTYYEKGAASLESGQYDEASASFNQAIDTGQYLAYAYRGLGLSRLCQSQYADACIAFERSLLNVENEGVDFIRDVSLYLAYSRIRHAETDKALEIYTTMLKQETDPEVLFLRGRLYMEKGETDLAGEDFDRAVSLATDYRLYISIYQIYHDVNMDADGARFLKLALDLVGDEDTEAYSRGLIYYYLQNYNEAETQLTKALQLNEQDREALLLLGRVCLAKGDTAKARAMFRQHLDDEEGKAAVYNGLSLCDLADGNYDSALENIEKGLALNDETANQALLFNRIVAYEKKHEWETAARYAASYGAAYPSDENGLRENKFLNERLTEQ